MRLRRICAVLGALIVLAGLPMPAAAQEPPLSLSASASDSELERGDTFTVTLSVYATSTTPAGVTLTATPPAGLQQSGDPQWSVAEHRIEYNKPITIWLTYQVTDQAPTNGSVLQLQYTVADTNGNTAAAATTIRVGTFAWPPPGAARQLYLPLLQR